MKRLFSTFCLLVGASVASYAGIINGASGTNLLGSSAVLMNFDAPATFPLGSFTSLPNTTTNSSVSVTASGPGTGVNSGSQGRINPNDAGLSAFFGGTISGSYLSSYSGAPGTSGSSSSQFARTLTLTFVAPVTAFTIEYVGSQTSTHQFAVAGLAGTTLLTNQTCNVNCATSGRQIGYSVDSGGPISSFSQVSFTFIGTDTLGFGDDVLFDNIRTIALVGGSSSSGSSSSSSGSGGEVPEPSTYALMAAGLLALGYARRKK